MGRLVEGIGSRRRPADEMGCRERPADVPSCRGTRPTICVAGGVRPTRWVVGGVHQTPVNKHLDRELVRERVEGWSTPAGCGEIPDEIER